VDGKLQKYRARTLQYMGHLLRCTLQQHCINRCLDKVVANPTHAHVVVDYKVGHAVFTVLIHSVTLYGCR
jgi:ribosomal 50S subunit-associated protein YjgA (DUF615 family)